MENKLNEFVATVEDGFKKMTEEKEAIKQEIKSLAEKLVFNIEAGSVQERGEFLINLARELNVSGAIHFSHWGCRQSSGGAGYLKSVFSQEKIPFLELTGDCVDHNSESAGQLKTRVSAFLEILGVKE